MKVNKITKNISESTSNSNGIYSLNTGWVKKPVKDDIPEVDLEPDLTEWRDRAKSCNSLEDINSFIDDIYILRQNSIMNDGEYGKGNLIFKEIRNEGILQELKDKKVNLENNEMSIKEGLKDFSNDVIEKLLTKYSDCSKDELDDVWDEIVRDYNDTDLADEVCELLDIRLDDLYSESLKPIKEEPLDYNESDIFKQKNEACIKEYRQWAGLSDDELITEDKINEWALNRVSCNNNYDYNDLKEVLCGNNK